MIIAARQKEKSKIKMKQFIVIAGVFSFAMLFIAAGCEPAPPTPPKPPTVEGNIPDKFSVYTRYVPAKIDIIPLTEFVCVGSAQDASKIRIYVSLLDSFDCQIKTPGTFRFELYRYIPRSAEPKGKRIVVWPDIDLTDTVENNNYWRDFLRAYEFNLDFQPEKDQSYILEATCLCPNDKRLSADFALEYTK